MQGRWRAGTAAVVVAGFVGAMAVPQGALAAPSAVFDGAVPCKVKADGVRFCSESPRSTVAAWDGVPIDVNVGLPSEAEFGPAPYPLIMMFHGYGGSKAGLANMRRWLNRGYATFSMTDRGFHESCGSAASRVAAGAACDAGYVRLIDNRYEVRDAQEFAGALADEGLIEPKSIGSVGGSYGGGMSMALGALRDRMVMPDYSLVPWKSPDGTPMEIAAATPNIPWTDLAYSLVPNGRTLDYVADAPYRGAVGVEKESLVEGLYFTGLTAPGVYAPEGSDPTADLVGWKSMLDAGEPYGASEKQIIDEITAHHSSYYIDDSIPPAPMLISSGFTDDLFPADETIRYYNRTRTEHPDAELALFFGDFGHPRAQNKDDVIAALQTSEQRWMAHYLMGEGKPPRLGVTAFTETCPEEAASGGPRRAPSWARIASGEVRLISTGAKTIAPDAGDADVAAAFNPVGGSACATADEADQPGAATYRFEAAPKRGYTMIGAVTVLARFKTVGENSEVAARLLDVSPEGEETLVSRGLWRPAAGARKQVFQLHPNGWRFAAGHVPKVELLPADTNPGLAGGYGRASNDQQPVTVKGAEIRIPVIERPGSFGGRVGAAAEPSLPKGYELAADFAARPRRSPKLVGSKLVIRRSGRRLVGKVRCPSRFVACNELEVTATKGGTVLAIGKRARIAGKPRTVRLRSTRRGRRVLHNRSRLKLLVSIDSAELAKPAKRKARALAR